MEVQSFRYTSEKGWSIVDFPELDSEQTLVLVFAAPEFILNPEPIKQLADFYSKSKMVGCSTAGEISGATILDNSISVAVVKFNKTTLKICNSEIKSTDSTSSFDVGKKLSNQLDAPNLKSIFVLSDGLKINGSELVKGLNTVSNEGTIITGGLAGDGSNFKQTWSIVNGEIFINNVAAVGFYGNNLQIGHASRGGWNIFGPERRITCSKNNILFELDGQPALPLYKEYLGDRASGLPATGLLYPLAIRKDDSDTKPLVRTILSIDENEQSLTFAGDVTSGYLAQLMQANFDRLITSASEAGENAAKVMGYKMSNSENQILAIAISCVGRRLLLGERTEEETESMLDALPPSTQQIGFYSYGEISPYTTGSCALHNQTMTLTTLYET